MWICLAQSLFVSAKTEKKVKIYPIKHKCIVRTMYQNHLKTTTNLLRIVRIDNLWRDLKYVISVKSVNITFIDWIKDDFTFSGHFLYIIRLETFLWVGTSCMSLILTAFLVVWQSRSKWLLTWLKCYIYARLEMHIITIEEKWTGNGALRDVHSIASSVTMSVLVGATRFAISAHAPRMTQRANVVGIWKLLRKIAP